MYPLVLEMRGNSDMAASHSEEDDRMLFAEELKAARAQRGWSSQEVADKIGFSQSTIKHIESGQRAPTPEQAERLDDAFGTSGTFQRMERWIRGVPFSAGFRPFAPHEQCARTMKTAHHSILPGLFQTNAYALAVLASYPDTSDKELQERLAGRLERQAILTRTSPPPPHIWALIDEQILYRNVGGAAVMHEQVKRLAELARMPRIHIQILPADAPHPGLMGAFVIAETGQNPAVVYLETAFDGQVVETPTMADTMNVRFETLRMEALTGSASLAKLEKAAQLWQERAET